MALRNPENAALICARVADNHTLREIGQELGCSASSITDWAREDDDFAAQYARAMDLRVERWAEEILEISDDGSNDWMEREGITVADHEHIQRSKLRVDSRKWLMSKMMPKKYGDRVSAEVTGADGKDLIPEVEPSKIALGVLAIIAAAKKGEEPKE